MRQIYKQNKIGVSFLVLFSLFLITNNLIGQNSQKKSYPQLLFPDFTKSLIKMKSGKTYTASLNYNTVDEEMIFNQNGVYMVLDKPDEIDTVYLQNQKFVYIGKAFYEILVKGPVSIYIEHKSHYTSAGSPTAYGMTSQTNASISVSVARTGNQVRTLDVPDNVKISDITVFWAKINDQMHKFGSERQFIKLFPEHESDIKDFIKTNKIDINFNEDLIKLGKYCNTLIK